MTIIEIIESLSNMCHLEPASEIDINNAQKQLNIKFADEYYLYVSKFGVISAKGIELTGITSHKRLNVVDVTLSERELNHNFPDNMYVIENLAIDGIIILQDSFGSIYEFAPYSQPKKIYNSLSEYIKTKQFDNNKSKI